MNFKAWILKEADRTIRVGEYTIFQNPTPEDLPAKEMLRGLIDEDGNCWMWLNDAMAHADASDLAHINQNSILAFYCFPRRPDSLRVSRFSTAPYQKFRNELSIKHDKKLISWDEVGLQSREFLEKVKEEIENNYNFKVAMGQARPKIKSQSVEKIRQDIEDWVKSRKQNHTNVFSTPGQLPNRWNAVAAREKGKTDLGRLV